MLLANGPCCWDKHWELCCSGPAPAQPRWRPLEEFFDLLTSFHAVIVSAVNTSYILILITIFLICEKRKKKGILKQERF